ncbi:MAG: AraC family transcriptional regulator [Verrucomicrobiae bacterium]|nr:AraC family transcriptional regulator [Verrucomicrobiae bacterium]
MSPASQISVVLDHLPDVAFFVKDREFRLVAANRNFWERVGCHSESDLMGRNDFDLFPPHLAENFRRDDEEVMATGVAKLKIIELFFNRQGLPDWYFTNKFPVFGKGGEVIGVLGTVQSYERSRAAMTPHVQLDRAVAWLRDHFREPIAVTELARIAGMSLRQFNRRFREAFGTNPRDFLIKTRVQAACEAMRNTESPIAEIAVDLGFYDQSSFTQHFRRHMGMTPLQYRKGG